MPVLDDIAAPAFLYGFGLDEEHCITGDEEYEAKPSQNADDAELGRGYVEDERREEDQNGAEHYPSGRDGKSAAGDGLFEVFPSESAESELFTARRRVVKAEVSSLLQDFFDLSLVLLRHVTTLVSQRFRRRSDSWMPGSVYCPASLESYFWGLCGVKTSSFRGLKQSWI